VRESREVAKAGRVHGSPTTQVVCRRRCL
jgi:hypothetical protein